MKVNYLVYIILGIIQGFTEPIPVSSSGHIFLFKNIFNSEMFNDLNFEIVANFGSFLAILFIFRKDVLDLLKAFFSYIFKKKTREENKKKFKYCLFILVSTIPIGIAGILLKDFIENKLQNIMLLGVAFLLTAGMLLLVKNKNGKKEDDDITLKDALIVGIFQIVALFPGISRSGTTLVLCLLVGMNRSTALKYTFILYFPISVGTMLLGVKDIADAGNLGTVALPYFLGMVAACIVTYFSYRWLSEIVKRGNLWKFSIYCVFLAIFIFIYFR